MIPLADDDASGLARDLASVLDAKTPGWTTRPTDDPGLTLLQVMAFLAEVVAYREPSPDSASLATHVIDRLRALVTRCEARGIVRVRYFAGQLLTAQDFTDDQRYHRDKLRRLIRCLHGDGVVSGLEVEIEGDGDDSHVSLSIGPGCAISNGGELLVVESCRRCQVTALGPAGFVSLSYVEHETHPIPAIESTTPEASRIEEGVGVAFTTDPPRDAVAIAKLLRGAEGWQVDRSFAPRRA